MGSLGPTLQADKQKSDGGSLKRLSTSFHNLHSPREQHIQRDYIWKKWRFGSLEQANKKYRELRTKQYQEQEYVISIEDVELNIVNKQNYEVKAKVEFSDVNLKTEVEKKCKCFNSYWITELWNITSRLTQIAVYLTENSLKLPHEMNSFLFIGTKLKVKDLSLFPGLKFDKKSPFHQNCSKIICRIITNLGLLTTSTEDVTLLEINRINLKYNPSIATFLYIIQDKQLPLKEIFQLQCQMSQTNKTQLEKFVFRTESKSDLYMNLMAKKQAEQSNYIAETDQKNIKSSLLQTPQMGKSACSLNSITFSKYKNYKRLQQIKPKQFRNFNLSSVVKEEQNKENQQHHNYQQQNKLQLGNIIDIDDHRFPMKVKKIKQFKKTSSTTLSDTSSKNIETRISQERNEAFIKLTGGEKCQLFAPNNEEQLLESIFQSEESVIIKSSESPVLNLDQQIQSITSDFMKLQPPFIQPEKYEQKSIFEFQNQRNSTIMEVTEEEEESQQKSKCQQIKSQFLNSLQQNSVKFPQECFNEDQEKFVVESYQGGSRFEGYLVNGLRNGFGKLYYEDGGSYEGHWKHGEIEGYGKLYYQSGELAYEGNWAGGEFHGEGKIINQCPQTIEGKFNYRDLSDIGASWLWYEGNFQHDNKHGNGILLLSNGQKFSGIWHRNNVEGDGIFETVDGIKISGRWLNNVLVQTIREEQANQQNDF